MAHVITVLLFFIFFVSLSVIAQNKPSRFGFFFLGGSIKGHDPFTASPPSIPSISLIRYIHRPPVAVLAASRSRQS